MPTRSQTRAQSARPIEKGANSLVDKTNTPKTKTKRSYKLVNPKEPTKTEPGRKRKATIKTKKVDVVDDMKTTEDKHEVLAKENIAPVKTEATKNVVKTEPSDNDEKPKKLVKKPIKNENVKIEDQDEIPANLAKLKGHPKYVAACHVKMYETIWPIDTAPISQVKTDKGEIENVYERKHLRSLFTRKSWLKKASVVRDGEVPAKMVANWIQNKYRKMPKDHKGLELFGKWQVEHYQPAVAANGKVPRNDYDNVELFQTCMLPIGTVWIRNIENGVFGRVCRKHNIDAAKAVIGFYQRGYPMTDGYVICKEFEKQAMEAYYEHCNYDEQSKEKERKIRIRKQWNRAYHGVLIQMRLKRMYKGEQIDPTIERLMMSKLNDDLTRITAKERRKAGYSKRSYGRGTKAESDDENEEEAESDSGSDSSSSDDESSVKPTSAIQRRATMPRRRAAQKAAKFDFSSDSSDFENSEDDFNLND